MARLEAIFVQAIGELWQADMSMIYMPVYGGRRPPLSTRYDERESRERV